MKISAIGLGILTAAAVGLVVVKKRNTVRDPDYDSLLGIGA